MEKKYALLSSIKLIAFDIDGVLTDGKVEIDEFGKEKKHIFLPDIDYMNRLKQDGYILIAVTGEDTSICKQFESRYPWNEVYKGCKNKDVVLHNITVKYGISLDEVCYVGDGLYDVPALKIAGVSICPRNGVREAKNEADIILEKSGGNGCIGELYSLLKGYEMETSNIMEDSLRNEIKLLVQHYPVLSVISEHIWNAYKRMEDCYRDGNKLLVAGNGGAASDSEHIVGELMKSFKKCRPIPSELACKLTCIDRIRGSDMSLKLECPLTAISLVTHESFSSAYSNDVDWKLVYAQQLLGYGRKGDIFLGISSSGKSENVINAAVLAKAMGITSIALTGGTGGELAKIADCAVVVPETETYMIQELHLPIYHCWCLMLEKFFFNN